MLHTEAAAFSLLFLGTDILKPWVAPRAPPPHPEVVGFLLVLGVLVLDVCTAVIVSLH